MSVENCPSMYEGLCRKLGRTVAVVPDEKNTTDLN